MTTSRLRGAIIGCGRIGTYTRPELRDSLPLHFLPYNHAEAMKAVPSIDLMAFCDTHDDNLQRAKDLYGPHVRLYRDYQTLILNERPEILSIATRTPSKCDMIEFACRHGVKGIHVEKPISNSLGDCRRALRAVQEQGVALTFGAVRRWMPLYEKARDLVQTGAIGELHHIEVRGGRTLLFWNHPHTIDLLLFFCPGAHLEWAQASCVIKDSRGPLHIEDDPLVETALMRFSSGVTVSMMPSNDSDIVLHGTQGSIAVVADRWLEKTNRREEGREVIIDKQTITVPFSMSGTERVFHQLAHAVRDRSPLGIELSEIEEGQAILMALAFSALNDGRRIRLHDVPDEFTVMASFNGNYA